jgi:hypothetical protein
MTPCGISWCVALTDKQFCPIHEKDQALHPEELDVEDDEDLLEDDDESDDEDDDEDEYDD